MDRRPHVGDIVLYQAFGTPGGEYPSIPRAAVVTAEYRDGHGVTSLKCGLAILNPTGMFFNPTVEFDADGKPGTWRWK